MIKRPKKSLNNDLIAKTRNSSTAFHGATCLAMACLMLGCASTPPSKSLPQSKVAVSSVDHNNYRKHLDSDVNAVKNKLKQAQAFAAEKQHLEAEQLAQQILVDVELIQIKTQRLNVNQEVTQIENSIANLNEELKWREPVQLSPLNQ
jgi:hypothetical protein